MALNTQWANRLVADLQRDFGLSLEAAQGIAGAFAMESKGFEDFTEDKPLVPGSRGGFGMPQWTGPRRRAFEAHAKELGLDINSYEAQYSYLKEELNGVGGHDGNLIKKLANVNDASEAMRITTNAFLRPSKDHVNWQAREEWTQAVVSGYVPLPPEEMPTVATELDLTQMVAEAPIPRSRAEMLAARTKALLERKYEAPTPRPRSEGSAARTNAALSQTAPRERVMLPELDTSFSQPLQKVAPIPADPFMRVTARNNAALEEGKKPPQVASTEDRDRARSKKAPTPRPAYEGTIARTSANQAAVKRNTQMAADLTLTALIDDGIKLNEAIRTDAPIPASVEDRTRARAKAKVAEESFNLAQIGRELIQQTTGIDVTTLNSSYRKSRQKTGDGNSHVSADNRTKPSSELKPGDRRYDADSNTWVRK